METIYLLYAAQLFKLNSIGTLIEIASYCEPSYFGDKKEGKRTISAFFEDREAFVKRELSAIEEHGEEFYLSEHARPYINALSQDEIKSFEMCLKWGTNSNTIERYLCQLFKKCRLPFITVNKEDFIYHAIRRGYNLEHEGQKISYQLVNIIKAQIDEELADAKNSIPAGRRITPILMPVHLRAADPMLIARDLHDAKYSLSSITFVLNELCGNLNKTELGRIVYALKIKAEGKAENFALPSDRRLRQVFDDQLKQAETFAYKIEFRDLGNSENPE